MGSDGTTSGAAPFRGLLGRLFENGTLRSGNPDVVVMAFVEPLLLWRQVRAVDPMNPLATDGDRFVRAHVEHFLHGDADLSGARA